MVTTPAQAQARKLVVYGGDIAFAPFESLDKAGRAQGFQIELLDAMSRIGKIDFEIHLRVWGETEAAFRDGRVDMVAMVDTRGRRAWANFSKPHATTVTGIYFRRGARVPLAVGDLSGGVIAIVGGNEAMLHTRETLFAGSEFRFLLVSDVREAFEAVRERRAEFALTARAYGDAVLARGGLDDVTVSDYSLRLQSYGFAVAPGNEALRQEVNFLLDQLESDGTLEKLRLKWLFSHREAQARESLVHRLWIERAALAVLALASALAIFWLVRRGRRQLRSLVETRRRWRAAEATLASTQARLERAFVRHPDAMLVSEAGRIVDLNDAFARMFGVEHEAMMGRAFTELPALAGSEVIAKSRALLDAHGYFENLPLKLIRPGGEPGYFVASGVRVESGGVPQVLTIVRDVTSAMQSDAGLRAEFEGLLAGAPADLAEIEQARAELERQREDVQGFTEAVAHDLRGPLRAIGGFANIMRSSLREGDVANALASAERIERAARRMDEMLSDLTRLAQAGRHALKRERVDMSDLARRVWSDVTAGRPEVAVDFRVDDLPPAHADPGLIAQVWTNLLENARKYSAQRSQSKVAVDSHVEDGVTWYRVVDNGAGFDMRFAGNMFRPFRRLHAAAEFPGTGLGLAIVERIVKAHGGAVRARGTPGAGAVFEFSLGVPPGN